MSRWWYYTLYRCPECGEPWEEYDPRGTNYDSGYSGPVPTQTKLCYECADAYGDSEDVAV
jgi:hypothetical protein